MTDTKKIPELSGSPAMQRILHVLLEKSPLSPAEIASRAHVALTSLTSAGYLKAMKASRLIHIGGWGKNHNGFTIPLYAIGDVADCPRPAFLPADRDSPGMARIVAALKQRERLGYKELAEASGLSPNTIRGGRYMNTLVEQRRVHVCGWQRNRNGPFYPQYAAGPGINMPQPKPLSKAERSQRHRARQQALSNDLRRVGAQLTKISFAGQYAS